MRKLFALLFVITISALLACGVYAHDYIRMDQAGSITMELQFENAPVIGGNFSCTKVADVSDENGNLYFQTLLEEEIYREELPAVERMERLVQDNETYFHGQKLTVTNDSGTVVFQNLLPGLYLVTQDEETHGYSKINAFLVSIPYIEDGVYLYDVTAKTKTALEKELPETTQPQDKDEELPLTGQLNWPVPVLAVSGLVVFMLGWYLRKKDSYEK